MAENCDNPVDTASSLEETNKQLAVDQARQINKELTHLKKISTRPRPAPVDSDKTGQFICVPLYPTQNNKIEEAYQEAKTANDSSSPPYALKKKKKWFNWG